MFNETYSKLDEVKTVLVSTLGLEDRASSIDAGTSLFGGLPELDSLALLELVANLEDRFEITIDDEDFTGETFETLGSLTEFVDAKQTAN